MKSQQMEAKIAHWDSKSSRMILEVMPDGIYYIAQKHDNRFRGGEIRFYDFATRRERLVQPLGDVEFLFGFSVSSDRKSFLYSVEPVTAADLMLVENFR
jgi:hypothetical protein